MSLLDLPNELILQISTDLSWRDVLHLRGTIRRLGSLLSTQLIDKVAEDPIWCPRALFFACTKGSGPHPPPTLHSDEPSPQDPTPGTRGGDNPTVRRILTTLSRTERGYGNVLLQAVQTKNLHIVTTLLNNGADADCRGTTIQCTPLHFAAASGEVRLVAQLVGRSDVDPNTCNLFPYPSLLDPGKVQYGTPLFDAVHNGHNEVVRLLLKDPRLDLNLPCGGAVPRTPLHTAVAAGNVDVVRMLLADDRIDVNLGCLNMANWDAPLHTAAAGTGLPDGYRVLMMLLADRRVNVNARGLWGHTPLHIAIASGGRIPATRRYIPRCFAGVMLQ